MVASLGSSFVGSFWRMRIGWTACSQQCRGSLKQAEPTLVLETQNPLRMGLGEPDQPSPDPLFSLVVGIRNSLMYSAFRPLPTHSKAYQSGSDGLCAYLPVG